MRASFLTLLVTIVLALVLSGCAPGPAPAASSSSASIGAIPGGKLVTVGFTASQSGSLNVESTRQLNGLDLWVAHVNAAGGIELSDGTRLRFQTKFYDDESKKNRVQQLYTRLINVDGADFLISPYSSGLTDAAAIIAEQYGVIMITAGAASDSTHTRGYTLVFQSYTPASRYLTGAFDLLAHLDPSAKKVAIIHENDKFSTDVSAAAKAYGEANGFTIVAYEGYNSDTTDFAPFINKLPPDTDAVMGGGHFTDGSTFAKQLYEKRSQAKFIALLVAPPEPRFVEIGPGAEGITGPSQWEAVAESTPVDAQAAGMTWIGPTSAEFVGAYMARFGEEPSYHSAGGYAAGLILENAIRAAGSVETDRVRAALDASNLMTFFGPSRFDTGDKHGLQIGHDMAYVQWQAGPDGQLVKQIVWPRQFQSANPRYPLR